MFRQLQSAGDQSGCLLRGVRDGKPSRKEYRHFNVKTVVGPDDFASMREIVGRRYRRLLEEGAELPQLIIVDGGKGQLSSAYGVLKELGLEKRIPSSVWPNVSKRFFIPTTPSPIISTARANP